MSFRPQKTLKIERKDQLTILTKKLMKILEWFVLAISKINATLFFLNLLSSHKLKTSCYIIGEIVSSYNQLLVSGFITFGRT